MEGKLISNPDHLKKIKSVKMVKQVTFSKEEDERKNRV